MLGGLITTLILLSLVIVLVLYHKKNHQFDGVDFHRNQVLGENGIEFLIACVFLLWLIPWGVIIIIPVALLISIISPAGRESWKQFAKIRAYLISAIILASVAGGFIPASKPISPDEWGEPLLKENPNAPFYPSGNQYTWAMLPSDGGLNVEIVQSLTLRSPHQFAKFGAASSALDLADLLNLQDSRLKQAVELLDQQIVLNLDPDEMKLIEIKTADKHLFVDASANVDYNLDIRLYELRSLTLSSDSDGIKVGEVVCVASSSWGGEVDLLVVVRPVGHTGLNQDRYAESLTVEWISAK
tara:strand:- start:124 stop:1020 length:897 start_codon:yes stop_codon:yes gene_type:complete